MIVKVAEMLGVEAVAWDGLDVEGGAVEVVTVHMAIDDGVTGVDAAGAVAAEESDVTVERKGTVEELGIGMAREMRGQVGGNTDVVVV